MRNRLKIPASSDIMQFLNKLDARIARIEKEFARQDIMYVAEALINLQRFVNAYRIKVTTKSK